MKKFKKNKGEGIVDLNQAKLQENEKGRPKVAANQKVPSPKNAKQSPNPEKSQKMPTINEKNKTIKPIGNVSDFNEKRKPIFDRDENGKILLNRRTVIYGSIGAGAVLLGGAGIKFITDSVNKGLNSVDALSVSKSKVLSSDDLKEDEQCWLNIKHEVSLPYGSLAWANSSSIITCLIPNEKAKPLCTVDLIDTNSANRINVLNQSEGLKQGFEIYDARANDKGIIWTEVNILQNEWKIYASAFSDGYSLSPTLIDKGDAPWETPTIAINNKFAYWQVLPKANGPNNKMLSSLRKVEINNIKQNNMTTDQVKNDDDIKNNSNTVYTSNGRMATPVYAYEDGVVLTPRTTTNNIYYQLTLLDNDDKIKDSLTLPQNMKPLEAGYGKNGFNFSFDAIYNYGEGLANLGTYTPLTKANENYTNLDWINFSRNPSAAPAWCDDLFIIRSTLSVCALNFNNQTYCILERPNASDDYGDYLASSGNCDNIVTFANIFDQPVVGEEKKYCLLRIWSKS